MSIKNKPFKVLKKLVKWIKSKDLAFWLDVCLVVWCITFCVWLLVFNLWVREVSQVLH